MVETATRIDLEQAHELEQRRKLKNDFAFYAKNCLLIRPKTGALMPLNLNHAQRHIHEQLEKQLRETGKIRAILLKGRQQGASTYVEGRYIWRTTHNPGVRAFILTHDSEATNALFEMTERYYENLPAHIKPKLGASNAKELHFKTLDSGYKIGTAGNKSVGRGQTIQYFHASECAYWQNANELTRGIMQAVPDADGTEVIFESTANGVGNFFHKQWKAAEKGLSEYIPIFVPWYWQEEYKKPTPANFTPTHEEQQLKLQYRLTNEQLQWRRVKIIELTVEGQDGTRSFKQEYPMTAAEAFQVTGADGLITPKMCAAARKESALKGNGALVIGVDPSRGGDRFAIVRRQGRKMYGMESYVGDDCNTLGKNVAICKEILDTVDPVAKRKPDRMFIDYGGGADLCDRLIELGYHNQVRAVNFAQQPLNPKRYKNKRNEIWGEMSLWLTDESMPADIPDDDEMQADLCASPYTRDVHDRKVLWAKDRIKQEYGFSPDFGDAAALTFSEPVGIGHKPRLKIQPLKTYTSR